MQFLLEVDLSLSSAVKVCSKLSLSIRGSSHLPHGGRSHIPVPSQHWRSAAFQQPRTTHTAQAARCNTGEQSSAKASCAARTLFPLSVNRPNDLALLHFIGHGSTSKHTYVSWSQLPFQQWQIELLLPGASACTSRGERDEAQGDVQRRHE